MGVFAMSQTGVVTLYDVASMAGVSTATVSRVVHGLDRVAPATRARVLAVIDQLGYVPDSAAQSLSRRRKDVIGLVCVERMAPRMQYDIESMSLLFYDEILRGVEATIRDKNWSLMITYLEEPGVVEPDDNGDEHYAPNLARLLSLSGKVAGMLIGEGIVPPPILARLADRLPVVVIAGSPREHGADVVTADNRSGYAALVTHLVEDHGRRRLFYVNGPETAPDAQERQRTLMQVLRAHPHCRLVGTAQGMFTVLSGEQAGHQLLDSCRELPDAVVCANDQMAIGLLQAFNRAGVRVPDDVAVVGFDDIFPASLCDPPLTTVHQPMRLLGERACARLLDRIRRPSLRPKVELLPTDLVLRSSCGCPPGTMTRRPVIRLRGRRLATQVQPAQDQPAQAQPAQAQQAKSQPAAQSALATLATTGPRYRMEHVRRAHR
jgi:LacI family transcriptional regulator